MAEKGIEPIYIRQRDLRMRDVSSYTICQAMSRVIGDKVVGAQFISGLWRLYVKDKASRIKLLAKRELFVENTCVEIYDKNPFEEDSKRKNEMDKLTIKFVPLTVDNIDVKKMLHSNGVELLSDVKYVCEKDMYGKLTNYKNGDRYVFVKAFDPPIKRSQKVCEHNVVVIHHGKDNKPCLACNVVGHKIGSEECSALPKEKIYTFRGYQHPLSNHYPYDLCIWDKYFKSNEHAFFYKMAMDMENPSLAKKIQNARHAGAAKAMSKEIADEATRNIWELSDGIEVMRELAFAKCQQCPEFIQCIYDYRECVFAEANPSKIWATGMSEFVSKHTSPLRWIGQNLLGYLITDIAKIVDQIIDHIQDPDGVQNLLLELGFENVEDIPNLAQYANHSVLTDLKCKTTSDLVADFDEPLEDTTSITEPSNNPTDDLDTSNTQTFDDVKGDLQAPSSYPSNVIKDVNISEVQSQKESVSNTLQKDLPKIKLAADGAMKLRKPLRRHSTDNTDDLNSILKYLDTEYRKKTVLKRKETASSPDKDIIQESKCHKYGNT